MAKEFLLQKNEKVLLDERPLPNLFIMWAITHIFITAVLGGVLLGIFAAGFGNRLLGLTGVVLGALFAMGLIFFIGMLTAWLRYRRRHYWVTNERVVYKSGMIGYKVSSIPIGRISDVMVSRSLMEQLFLFGSVHVKTFAGQSGIGSEVQSDASLKAIPNPEKVQKLIMDTAKQSKGTPAETAPKKKTKKAKK